MHRIIQKGSSQKKVNDTSTIGYTFQPDKGTGLGRVTSFLENAQVIPVFAFESAFKDSMAEQTVFFSKIVHEVCCPLQSS